MVFVSAAILVWRSFTEWFKSWDIHTRIEEMAGTMVDSDDDCRIGEGEYVVLKRGDVYKSVQIEKRK